MRESFSCLHEIGMNGYTPASLVRLTAKNLKQDESGDWLVVVRDKGGKDSIQLILPEEVDFVRETLSKGRGSSLSLMSLRSGRILPLLTTLTPIDRSCWAVTSLSKRINT